MTDLEWLARNVREWNDDCASVVAGINHSTYIFTNDPANPHSYSKTQWLAKRAELQNKPSWDDAPPGWANWLAQDDSSQWFWYQCKPRADKGVFLCYQGEIQPACRKGEVLGRWQDTLEERPSIGVTDVLKHAVNTAVDDLDTGKIVPQSSEPPTWNGEGLPPVGCECEHKNGNIYTVTGHANVATEKPSAYPLTIIYKDRNGATWSRPASDWGRSFKPFKTERQKAVEELALLLNNVVEEPESGRSIDAANYLYDHGYRKVGDNG